ncbi:MAG TPA: trypsin-like peptidase domain-containing protein, partial [Minicystis sp.]|nr:trypsin-like peptidase domain-containing protein [Minicystis sp.]
MLRWASLFALAAASVLTACAAPPRASATARAAGAAAPSAPAAPALPDAEIVERALPAVVLVLNTHADGTITYGAGFVVRSADAPADASGDGAPHGFVLTSQHVVAGAKALGAMLYKPGRPGYTPMDGGLSRYLFENQGDVVHAVEIAGDATSDLAVVRIDADTSRVPALPLAKQPVHPGDRVLALGHPQETVWSFTAGVVGAIQQGAIQHDAAIGHGSSGGPLLNTRGEVVGINVAMVVSESRGLAFARPIAFASRYLDAPTAALGPLDQSSPEASAVSCWRA